MLTLLETIDGLPGRLRAQIRPAWKTAFFSTLIFGLICHLYGLMGHNPAAYSGLTLFVNDPAVQIGEGRWFAALVMEINSDITLPWIIGLMSILCYAVSNVFLVEILSLKKSACIVLVSATVVTFPVITSGFAYLYMADVYAVAMLLATAAVFAMEKCRRRVGFPLAMGALALAISAYQAILSYALMLILLLLLFALFDRNEPPFAAWAKKALSYAAVVLGSLAAYGLSLYIVSAVTGIGLSANQGISRLGTLSLSAASLWRGVSASYAAFSDYFTVESHYTINIVVQSAVAASALVVVALAGLAVARSGLYKSGWRLLLLITLPLAVPPVLHYAYFVAPDAVYFPRMRVGYVVLFILGVALWDRMYGGESTPEKKRDLLAKYLTKFSCYALSATLIFYSVLFANVAYLNARLKFEKEYSLAVRLVDRIEQHPEYEIGMPVYIHGTVLEAYHLPTRVGAINNYLKGMEQRGDFLLTDSTAMARFIELYVQTDMNIIVLEEDGARALCASEAFEALVPWPSPDCTAVISDMLVIRLE